MRFSTYLIGKFVEIMTENSKEGAYPRRAQRPKAKMIEPEILLIHFKYLGFILFRRLLAKRLRIYHQSVEPTNTPRIQIPAAA